MTEPGYTTVEDGAVRHAPTTQRGHWAVLDDVARRRLIRAHDVLAARLGRPSFDAAARTPRRPELAIQRIGEVELTALLAESLVRLHEDVDDLRVQLAALEGKRTR